MNERRRQKMLERKRRKREDKRKEAASHLAAEQRIDEPEPWLTQSLVSRLAAPKMSDTLVAFARNELDALPKGVTTAQFEMVLVMAMGVWNAVVAGPESTLENRLWELSRTLLPSSDPPPEDILPLLRTLAERKRLLFANDRRLVMNVSVTNEGDHFHIIAASVPGPS